MYIHIYIIKKNRESIRDATAEVQVKILGHLICLFTLIINYIYGLGVGISTIKKFTSGRGWGMIPRGPSYKAFNLPSHPIYMVPGWGSRPLKSSPQVGDGVWPRGLRYNTFNLPSHPSKYRSYTHFCKALVYIHIYILKKLYEWHVMCCYGYIETWSVLIINKCYHFVHNSLQDY